MPTVIIETLIAAPAQVCFDLARNIDAHCASTGQSRERAVAGKTTGLIGPGEWVTFEATHFRIRQRLTSRITIFEPPKRFVDEMTEGAFKSLKHIHEFVPQGESTLMRDTLIWTAPLGVLGRLADVLFLERYMRGFLETRNLALKTMAEPAPV